MCNNIDIIGMCQHASKECEELGSGRDHFLAGFWNIVPYYEEVYDILIRIFVAWVISPINLCTMLFS